MFIGFISIKLTSISFVLCVLCFFFWVSLVSHFCFLVGFALDFTPGKMMKKILSAEHISQKKEKTEIIEKKRLEADKTEMWMIFSGPDGEKEFASTIWETIRTAYFETLSHEDPYDRFEEALKIVNAQIAENEIVADPDFFRLHSILIGLFAQQTLHITVAGNAEGYLIRKTTLTTISDGLSAKEGGGDIFVNIASGDIEEDDHVVFSTERLLRHATQHQLSEMLSTGIVEGKDAAEELLRLAGEDSTFVLFHAEKDTLEKLPLEKEKEKRDGFKKAGNGVSFFKSIPDLFTSFFRKLRNGDQKPFLALVLGILGLIVIYIFISSLSGNTKVEEYDSYKNILNEVRDTLSTIEDQETMGEVDMANANLNKVDRDLEKILSSEYFRAEAAAYAEQASQIRDRINNITRISTPKEMANLKSRKNEVNAVGVFEYESEWYAFDANTLFRIVLDNVENVIPLSSEDLMTSGTPFLNKQKMVFSDAKGKIFEYDVADGQFSLAKTEDDNWKKSVEMQTYAKYLYLLSPEDSQIWKYERKTDNYGVAVPYFQEEYDISGALSFGIDGYVYVFTREGNLLKFLKGFQEEYEITGAPEDALAGVTQIYTDTELEYILMLNPSKSTVYVFFKGQNQAEYSRQVVFENVGTLKKMWAKAPQTLIVVDEAKVYQVDF